MARRRTLNHKELRADYEAAERRKQEAGEGEDEELEDEDEDEDEEEASDEDEGEGGDEDDEAPAKKPKKKAAPKEAKPKRVRTPKVVRQKVVWAVFNNSNQRVASFDYPKKKEAEDHAAKLSADKKQTFFVQPVKEPMEEK
jgi:hypothetical protein